MDHNYMAPKIKTDNSQKLHVFWTVGGSQAEGEQTHNIVNVKCCVV